MTSPFDQIAELARALEEADLGTLELSGPGGHLRLVRGAHDAGFDDPSPPGGGLEAAATSDPVATIASPGVGHFLRAHPLSETPLVDEGAAVAAGEPVGLLRIGMLLIAVPAPRDGVVAAFRADDGALVGYGDPLATLRPET